MTDRQKIIELANIFRDEYIEKPKSISFTDWEKRICFNQAGEIVKIQKIIGYSGNKIRYE